MLRPILVRRHFRFCNGNELKVFSVLMRIVHPKSEVGGTQHARCSLASASEEAVTAPSTQCSHFGLGLRCPRAPRVDSLLSSPVAQTMLLARRSGPRRPDYAQEVWSGPAPVLVDDEDLAPAASA